MVVGITRSQQIPIPKISTDVPGPSGQRIMVADALYRTPSVPSQGAEPATRLVRSRQAERRNPTGCGARRNVFVVSSLLLSGESTPRRHLDAANVEKVKKQTNQPQKGHNHENQMHTRPTRLRAYLDTTAPAGKEKNWLRTAPGKGYFEVTRLQRPNQSAFDKTWEPGDIE